MALAVKAEELQKRFAEVDLFSRSNSNGMELLVLKLDNLRIKMYQEQGHSHPHIHIDYGKSHHIASYSILNGTRLAGSLSKKYDRNVSEWVLNNKDVLEELWHEIQKGNKTEVIIANIRKNT